MAKRACDIRPHFRSLLFILIPPLLKKKNKKNPYPLFSLCSLFLAVVVAHDSILLHPLIQHLITVFRPFHFGEKGWETEASLRSKRQKKKERKGYVFADTLFLFIQSPQHLKRMSLSIKTFQKLSMISKRKASSGVFMVHGAQGTGQYGRYSGLRLKGTIIGE